MDFNRYVAEIIDQAKDFIFSDMVNKLFMDYTKNELLTMFYLFRTKEANMGQIAEYLHAPLNTATGVVSRLVKKRLIDRFRSDEDRRIVLLKLTKKAKGIIEEDLKFFVKYFSAINNLLDDDERAVLISVAGKAKSVLLNPDFGKEPVERRAPGVRKIVIE